MPQAAGGNEQPAAAPVWEAALIGSSPEMLGLTKTIWRLAQAQADSLILGETGTGKSLAAALIHRWGPRKLKAFAVLNGASLTAAAFANEMFGHEVNDFSGAVSWHPGRVEAASGGIVCLEEIGNLSGDQQANLLAFLETKNLARPGGREPVQPDVQLLFTASQNLEEKVAGGKFRRDLYDRLQSSAVRLPRLRDHAQDIPALIWYFIQKFNAFYGRKIQRLAPEALLALQSAPWDGNVSELKTQVEAAVRNCAEQTLQVKDFANLSAPATELPRAAAGLDQPYREAKEKLLQEFHQAYLGHHLSQHNWNRSRTARAIGIMREQLNALVRRYKLARPKSNETGAAQ